MTERTITVERIEYIEHEDGSTEDLTTTVVSTVTVVDDLTPAEWDAKDAAALAAARAVRP